MASTIKLVNRSFQEGNQFQFSNRCCCFWTSLSWWIRLRTPLPRLWAFNSEVILGNSICSDILKFDQQCPKSFSYSWAKNSTVQFKIAFKGMYDTFSDLGNFHPSAKYQKKIDAGNQVRKKWSSTWWNKKTRCWVARVVFIW